MKQLICILLCVCAVLSAGCTVADYEHSSESVSPTFPEEITFQNYFWGESVLEVSAEIGKDYFESNTPGWSDADKMLMVGNYSVGYQIFSYGDENIAGYDVANFKMYFMYGHNNNGLSTTPEDSELYLVTMNLSVVDVESAYNDLLSKLTGIYGNGTTNSSANRSYSLTDGLYKSSITTTTWLGKNNTGIILSKSVPEDSAPDSADMFNNYVVLSYGKTNSDNTLSIIYNEYRKAVAEEERESRDTSNSSGL